MEQPEESEFPETPRKNPYTGLRRGLMALGLLCIVWLLFGKVLPSMLFGSAPEAHTRQPASMPSASAQEVKSQIAALEERINQLEARLKTYEDIMAATPPASAPDSTALEAKIAEWQAAMEAKLEHAQDNSAHEQENKAQLEQLQQKIESAESKTNHKLAALTAFGQLKEAFTRGDAYAISLKTLMALTPDNAAAQDLLAQLASDSETGVPTLGALQQRFSILIPQALAAGSSKTLFGNMGTLIKVRKVGEQQHGMDDESIFARAEAKLNRGDVDGCLKELAALSPPAATTMASWVATVQTIHRLRDVIDALQLAITDGVPAPSAGPAKAVSE